MEHSLQQRSWPGLRPGHALLCIASISWCFLMSPLLTAGPLALDEHGSYWIIDSDLPGTSLQRSLDYAAIPPLSSWMQQAFLTVFGKSEFIFRLPSALCALAAMGVCYQAGKELRDDRTGGLAAILVVWHPEAMDEVRIARCYGLVLLLGAVVLWATIRWYRTPRSAGWAVFWSLSATALLWTHYTSALLVATSGLFVAAGCFWRRDLSIPVLTRLIAAALLLSVMCAPLVPAILRIQGWGPFLNYSGAGASIGDVIGPFWWAGLPAGVLLAWAISRERSTSEVESLCLTAACALLPLLILAVLSSGDMSSLANPRYRVAYAPAGVCFTALLLTSSKFWRASIPGTLTILVVAWSFSPGLPWLLGRLGSATDQQWRELNAHLVDISKPHEPILVQSGLTEGHLVPAFAEDELFMEYVACRVSRFYVEAPHERLALPFVWGPQSEIIDFYRNRMGAWRADSGTFWIACATDTDLNRNSLAGIQQVAEDMGFEAIETRVWPDATLIHFMCERSGTQ